MGARDVVIIGGGITGAGAFHAAAAAGLSAALVENGAPGGRTTRASSGLLHGGLRYLPYDAATSARSSIEAGELARAYPALVRRQAFLWPVYAGGPRSIETIETLLELYDELSQPRGAFRHLRLPPAQALAVEPGLRRENLLGALSFDEWAVDAAGLVRALIEDGQASGGTALHGRSATGFRVRAGRVLRVELDDGSALEAGVVVNAAGPWAGEVAALAGCSVRLTLRRGSHLVVPGNPARHALIFPDESGRFIGLYPREGEAWIGPTDEPHEASAQDARPAPAELERLRRAALAVLPALPALGRGVAGVRPILRQALPGPLSRDYRVLDHAPEGVSNLVTVTGGKLTLFRAMADEAIERVCGKLGRPAPRRAREGWLFGRAAHNRALCLAGSAALLAAWRLRHALRGTRTSPDGAEAFERQYGAR